jgi:hypothetical protein
LKKQYWISEEHNFKRRVILFDNDKPITLYDGFDADKFIEQAESEGYVEGYLRKDVREIWNKYKYMLDRMIDYSDSPWDVEVKRDG